MNTVLRTLSNTPGALIVTAGLGLLMAGLIRAEYIPAVDKADRLDFTSNQPAPDLPPLEIERPILLIITPPPAAPKISIEETGLPDQDTFTFISTLPKIPDPEIDIEPAVFRQVDTNAKPILPLPPAIPTRFAQGNHSGYCKVLFDVSPEGAPYNVEATYCTSRILERATVKSVLKWKFRPKIQDGHPVAMRGVENEVTFQLLNEHGQLLPEI